MLKELVKTLVIDSIKAGQKDGFLPTIDIKSISLLEPEIKEHGDYSTNLAFVLAGQLKKSPQEIAQILLTCLQKENQKQKLLQKIEINNGFLNLFLSENACLKELEDILKLKSKYGSSKIGQKQKLQVEFISANPTGPLTIGNARGGPFGDCLANVLKKVGYSVFKEYYINDCGNQIISLGHSVLKDALAQYKGSYIDVLSRTIKDKDPAIAGKKAAKIIIDKYIKKTTDRLGIKYDKWFFESQLQKTGKVKQIIEELEKKGLIYKKDGASWFKSTQFKDERDRVVIKKDGQTTYLAADVAYHKDKLQTRKFKQVINIWGADHFGDVAGLQAGVSAIGYPGQLKIILLQFVTLFKGKEILKMSKREGIYITLDDLLDMVGKDAVRYFFLSRSVDTHLNFDVDLAQQKTEANPVFYIQYAYARICSVFRKAKIKSLKPDLSLLNDSSEISLIKTLSLFPHIIEEVANNYQAQKLPKYAFDLATAFHKFYQDCRLISEDKKLTQARLSLAQATKIVLKETLNLMGISAPEKM